MRIALLSWRDRSHPEGGGAEHYLETVAHMLVERGHEVVLYCAAYPGSRSHETRGGVTYRRQGGRVTVYGASVRALRRDERRFGRYDVVIDVQNGLPFFATAVTKTPVIVLVHHVHREQWPVVFGPVAARIGWFIESVVASRWYRRNQYVAVSGRTRAELATLGVDPERIATIHNGTDLPMALGVRRAADPTLVVLGRLVPHKRVEHAVAVLSRLRSDYPGLRLRIIGDGWYRGEVRRYADSLGLGDEVQMLGYVSEETKHAELSSAWISLAPSIKEGWGLSVVDAASHGVPTVAYNNAGGLSESIIDGRTGLLVEDLDAMTDAVRSLIDDTSLRQNLGACAARFAGGFSWQATTDHWEALLTEVARGAAPHAYSDMAMVTAAARQASMAPPAGGAPVDS